MHPSFNFFYGDNGAGKTSLLEALYLLCNNRSFRSSKLSYTIQNGAAQSVLFASFTYGEQGGDGDEQHKLGIQRRRGAALELKLDGEPLASTAQLAKLLPCLALDPSSFDLLDASPSGRRALLDWLVFHVKHEFYPAWKAYQRCLKQRNMLLRRDKLEDSELDYWDALLVEQALILERCRYEVRHDIAEALKQLLSASEAPLSELSLEYKSGWPSLDNAMFKEPSKLHTVLLDALRSHRTRDLKQGFTGIGSHKFDLLFRVAKQPAAELLSRGQKKTCIVCLFLALGTCYRRAEHTQSSPIYLLDDLASELDQEHLSYLLGRLNEQRAQCFISTVQKQSYDALSVIPESSWFHVKHGTITAEE